MAKKVINVGITANDTLGDPLRTGAQAINDNFTELYNALGGENGAPLSIVSKLIAGHGIIVSSSSGDVLVTSKTASEIDLGGIRIGPGISIDEEGIASVNVYELPKASSTILGGIKVGDRLSINAQGVLSADPGAYTLPKATSSALGGIKIGSGLEIDGGGIVSVSFGPYNLPTATHSVLGGIKVGNRLTITNGVLSADIQTVGIADRLTASDKELVLDTTGRISYPGNGVHEQSNVLTIDTNTDTVVYTTNGEYVRAIKIFALIEKFTNGYESQACEIIATIDDAMNEIYVSVYGITYTGEAPIAAFDGEYTLSDGNFKITARPTSTNPEENIKVRVQITELNGTD
jgi:hypothetical protein